VNLPNLISLARLLSVPLAVWFVFQGWMASAFWLFVIAGISDAVDGYLARRFSWRTTLGSYLDPLADKVLLVSVYLALGLQAYLPAWLVILVVFRDLFIVGGVMLMHTLTPIQQHIAPLRISKFNTVAQIVLAGCTLAAGAYDIPDYGALTALVYIVAISTFASGAAYVWRWAGSSGQAEGGER